MRRWIPAVLWTLLPLSACVAPSTELSDVEALAVQEEVTATVDAFVEALNRHDPEEVMSFYAPEADLVRLGCTNIAVGLETIRQRITIYHQQRKDVTFSMEVAYVKPLTATSAVASVRGGTSNTAGLFWSLGMVEQPDGRWLIAYEHQSWPDCPEARGFHTGGAPSEAMLADTLQ